MKGRRLLGLSILALAGLAGAAGRDPGRDTEWHFTSNEVPLRSDAALLRQAEALGDGDPRRVALLEKALQNGGFEAVVRLELAEMLCVSDPDRAVRLVLELLRSGQTSQIRKGALETIEKAAGTGLSPEEIQLVGKEIPRLRRSSRRRLQVALAEAADTKGRKLLDHAISRQSTDLPALRAARKLLALEDLVPVERLHVAEVLYRHALYAEAIPLFEALIEDPTLKKKRSHISYLLGRCFFRRGEYEKARSSYHLALRHAPGSETRASLEVHIARCFELEGALDQAILHARQAVLDRSSDARRLFLARLRLRTHRPDLAALGISRIRSSSRRSRGALLTALFSMASGQRKEALHHLAAVGSRIWKGPAGVLAASIHLEEGNAAAVLKVLRRVSARLDPFWMWRARLLMTKIPGETTDAWRNEMRKRSMEDSSAGLRALREWATLEFRQEVREEIRTVLAGRRPLGEAPAPEEIRGLAGKLYRANLPELALKWDPGSFPAGNAAETLWSAAAARDFPWLAIRLGDRAWRQWGSDFPPESMDPRLLEALYPLPQPGDLETAVAGCRLLRLPLLAGIAREESRWDPHALSAVGARGLLQLMPATAREAARREGLSLPEPSDLFQRKLNLRLGASEIEDLLRHFGAFTPAAVSAYNAGTDQAELWKLQCGESCSVEAYVLMIGFDATRHYTQDVLLSEVLYRAERADDSG